MAKIRHAEASVRDKMDIDLFASAQLGNALTPLPAIVSTTGTVGDISASSFAWWQSVGITSGSFQARGLSDLRSAWNQVLLKNPQGPVDFIISDRTSYEAYEAVGIGAIRKSNERMLDLSFDNFEYKGATWTFDTNCPSGNIFGLHSKSLELVQAANRIFKLSEWVKPIDQDLHGAQIFWAGELTTNNRRKHFNLTSVTA
jgi:hypothetical protein